MRRPGYPQDTEVWIDEIWMFSQEFEKSQQRTELIFVDVLKKIVVSEHAGIRDIPWGQDKSERNTPHISPPHDGRQI